MVSFTGKLTGARARLFAEGCLHYMGAAEDACNDTPPEYPLFSWLSPHQRLALVAQVAIGLLCPDEPLPPPTLEHVAAYHGVIACIETELQIEMDESFVGEDLLKAFEEATVPCQERSVLSKEEQRQRIASMALIDKVAAKNRKKLNRKANAQEKEVEFKAEETNNDPSTTIAKYARIRRALFSGPPCTEQDRRPPRPLTDDEKDCGFRWRLLCDAAFQEDTPQHTSVLDAIMPPLCTADFCWKSYDANKWTTAVNLLMVIKYFNLTIPRGESALLHGVINDVSYADRTQHARIVAVTKRVKDLRASYDSFWDASKLAIDQRLIFAICSTEFFCSKAHHGFALAFCNMCHKNGFELSEPGNYQQRLKTLRSVQYYFKDGLDKSYCNGRIIGDYTSPSDYEPMDSFPFVRCAWSRCWEDRLDRHRQQKQQGKLSPNDEVEFPRDEDLKYCERCKVVRYCCKSCQVQHWRTHRKDCPNLAAWRKDKEKLQELVKEF